jgi:hypothetical protein
MDSIESPSQFHGGGGDCRPGRRDALQDGAKGEDPHQGLAAKRRRRRGGSGGYLARSSQQHREQGRRGGRGEQQYCFQHAPLLHVDSRSVHLLPKLTVFKLIGSELQISEKKEE